MKAILITAQEASRIYQVSTATVYRWAKEDNLWSIQRENKRHYDLDSLQRCFNKRRTLKHIKRFA